MTPVPIWAAIAVSIGTPTFTLLGVVPVQAITRAGARELESRSRRGEVMRNLRWAAEMALDADPSRSRWGLSQVRALARSNLNDSDVQHLVDAALESFVGPGDDDAPTGAP